jgi:hypothetical protein
MTWPNSTNPAMSFIAAPADPLPYSDTDPDEGDMTLRHHSHHPQP